jgi:large subunit ribosomal protein L15
VEKYSLTEFTPDTLYVNGLINRNDLVKVLGSGEVKTTVPIKVNAASAKAKDAISAAGGSIEIL